MASIEQLKQLKQLKLLMRLSLGLLALGIALLGFMVTMEGELGALPLLLVIVGVVATMVSRYRLGRQAG